jgi:hypothetical protein
VATLAETFAGIFFPVGALPTLGRSAAAFLAAARALASGVFRSNQGLLPLWWTFTWPVRAQELNSTCIYNGAFDVWIGDGTSNELMIWTDNKNQVPAGSKVGTVTFGGYTYDVWHSSGYTAHVSQVTQKSGTMPLASFSNDMSKRLDLEGHDLAGRLRRRGRVHRQPQAAVRSRPPVEARFAVRREPWTPRLCVKFGPGIGLFTSRLDNVCARTRKSERKGHDRRTPSPGLPGAIGATGNAGCSRPHWGSKMNS